MAPETGTDRREIEQLRAEVARLERAIVDQREDFDRELVRRAFRINRLEEEVGRGTDFERTLSWQVTKPLRAFKAKLRSRLRG